MPPQFEFLMRIAADVGEVVTMGGGPLGERRVVSIDGGTFEGPQLAGRIEPGGADWQIVRADGVLDIDARYVLRTAAGAAIRVVSQGYRYGPPEVLASLASGEAVAPERYFFRTVMRFETGAPDLLWLNRSIAVASAERKARQVLLESWRLR
ncbi:MAG: DUF3237 domain-containing protein [Betaproteobacteria bacterium]|nr:DUF3237 domain-containing protein [Betaproteobacteria bacterium]MDH5219963.1 DUF3237 domain-containing protein [Betaproteobacteria bacterium]MDH5350787.1 DUF3237 domain-containing protein [Betaproteobacteria bacterium]